ncbi:MAG: PIN domain-containing protein [Verrucomicrobia bacterium]|jgi:predicted nucleic acid-binding protein|nr:PIN domain-containing protein [Verrucomicrobiota bacterium]
MTHAIDTDFLVALEIRDHIFHKPADGLLNRLLDEGHELAVAPQILAEFVHVVTDAKRMKEPLSMDDGLARAEYWWQAREVLRIYPDGETVTTWIAWLRDHRLGRKRLLDTLLAASCASHGISTIISNNGADFQVFGKFSILSYHS